MLGDSPTCDPAANQGASSELIGSAIAGDRGALESLLLRHLSGLEVFVRLRTGRKLGGRESSTDIVQSACREVLADLHAYRHESEAKFRNWLYTSALRKIQDKARYWAAEKRQAPVAEGEPRGGRLPLEAANFVTPSGVAMAREDLGHFESALEQLSDEQREIILLRRIVGLSHAEIAEAWQKSEGVVRKLYSRASSRLLGILSGMTSR